MNAYYYYLPLVKSSTKQIKIIRDDGKMVGTVQRYFKSHLHQLIDLVIGRSNLIVNIKGKNSEDRAIINAYTQMAMIKRPYYYLHFLNGEWRNMAFRAIQTNNININAQFNIKSGDVDLFVDRSFNLVRFFEGKQEIAILRSNIKEKNKTYLEVARNVSVQEPLFYVIYQQLFYFIGY